MGLGAGAQGFTNPACGRCLEDVEAAARPGGALGPGGASPLTPRVRFSLQHRRDLLADCPAADVAEMEAAVLASLNRVAGARALAVRAAARAGAHGPGTQASRPLVLNARMRGVQNLQC
jgi:hypothetical protein